METDHGLKPDVQFVFDLELPPEFSPRNTDGEVDSFELWNIEDVARCVETTDEFKFNCSLVVIHFLLREGVISPEHPEYIALCENLGRPFPEEEPPD